MAEDNVIETVFTNATDAIERAHEARETADTAYTEAFDEFAEVEHEYEKLTGEAAGPGGVERLTSLAKKYGPTALKYFGAGGAGASVLLALSKDGTGAGILSKLGGIFGLGG